MASLRELREELTTKRRRLEDMHAQAGPDLDLSYVQGLDGDPVEKAAQLGRLHRDLNRLGEEVDRLAQAEEDLRQNARELERLQAPVASPFFGKGSTNGQAAPGLAALGPGTLARHFRDHPGLKAFRSGEINTLAIDLPGVPDLKTLITLTTISPQALRQPDIQPMALEERTVSDLLLTSTVDRGPIEYYEETTVTNNAATVGEGLTKPESALGWTLRSEPIRKIATNIPLTKESIEDNGFLEGQVRGRLAYMVQRVEEAQILSGDATGTNLRGILNRVGIQTQARGTESNMDAVMRAMQLIRGSAGTGFAEPTAIVMHPTNYTTVKLTKTADGIYIWGPPADEGPERLWGKPIRQTTGITANTALVGAFRPWAEVLRREGISVTMSTEHSTFFADNKVLLQAESRIALAVYRPSAFASVTGLN